MSSDLIHLGQFCKQHMVLIKSLDSHLKGVLDESAYEMTHRVGKDLLDHCYVQLDNMIERMGLWFHNNPKHSPPDSTLFAGNSRQERPSHLRSEDRPPTTPGPSTTSTTPRLFSTSPSYGPILYGTMPTPSELVSKPPISKRRRIHSSSMMYFGGPLSDMVRWGHKCETCIIAPSLSSSHCDDVIDTYAARVWDGRVPNYVGLTREADVIKYSILEANIISEDFPEWNSTFGGDVLECMSLNRSYINNDPEKYRRDAEILPTPAPFIISGLVGVVVGIITAISATYAVEKLTDITDNKDQATNVHVLQHHQTRLQIDSRSIRILNTTISRVSELLKENTARVSAIETLLHLGYTASGLYDEVNRLMRAWNALATHRVTPDVFKGEALALAIEELEDSLRPLDYDLGITKLTDVFNCEVSTLVREFGHVQIIIHLPTYRIGSQMKLLEARSLPIHFDGGDKEESFYFWPDLSSSYLAVSKDEKSFRTFNERELNSCSRLGDIYFCESDIVSLKPESSCISAMYQQRMDLIKQECTWTIHHAEDHAEHIGVNTYALYQAQKGQIDQYCPKEPDHNCDMSISGLVQFTIRQGCSVRSKSYSFQSGVGITAQADAYRIRNVTMNAVMMAASLDSIDNDMMEPHELKEAVKNLDLIGSRKGLKIVDIKSLYKSRNRRNQWQWGLGSFTGLALCIGLCLILWKVFRCSKPSPNSNAELKQEMEDMKANINKRGEELEQQAVELQHLAEGLGQRRHP